MALCQIVGATKKMIKNKIEADVKMHWLFLLFFEFYL